MSHFNVKSLAFYGTAIGAVVVLFSVVTAYGNANLKAPPPVAGRYRLNAQNLPGCLKADALLLNIVQSGEYLSGSLLPTNSSKQTIQKRPSLHGELQNQQLSLAGPVSQLPSCNQAGGSRVASSVKINSQLQGKTLNGQINLSSIPQPAQFTAQLEPPEEKQEKH